MTQRPLLLAAGLALALAAASASAAAPAAKHKLKPGAVGTVCLGCHTAFAEKLKLPAVHTPVREKVCTSCHNPHASDHGKLLAHDLKDACVRCHANVVPASARSTHAPVAERSCAVCHDPHASRHKDLLVKPGSELCAGCHKELVSRATSAKVKHAPAAKGACTECHDAHRSETAPALLRRPEPGICTGCHKPGAPAFAKAHSGYEVASAGCTSCHDPHGGDRPGLLQPYVHAPVTKGMCNQCHEPAADKTFKLRAEGAALCKRCHAGELQKMSDRGLKHRPVADGDCLACHSPHASRWKGLLAASPVPLCGSCHGDTIARQERSVAKHPPMLQGDCTACHDPHASDRPLLLAQASIIDGCGSCHDWKGHQSHPIGGELVDPRNKNRGIDCLSCHRAHGTEHKRLFPYATLAETCTKCHRGLQR